MPARRTPAAAGAQRLGRRRAVTSAELSSVALRLFSVHGFERTTVEEIAAAAGIGRRTFFRYFASKNDLPWGDFDDLLVSMRRHLDRFPASTPLMTAVRAAVVEFNRFPPSEAALHRQRMELLFTVPALRAHSTLRYQSWRTVIAQYAATRLALDPDDLLPQAVGHAALGAALAAYEHWLAHPGSSLSEVLDGALAMLEQGFPAGTEGGRPLTSVTVI